MDVRMAGGISPYPVAYLKLTYIIEEILVSRF